MSRVWWLAVGVPPLPRRSWREVWREWREPEEPPADNDDRQPNEPVEVAQ